MSTTPAVPSSIVPPALAGEESSIEAHLATVLAVAVGFIALFHPGFRLPQIAETILPAVAWVAAGAIFCVHLVSRRGLKGALAVAWADLIRDGKVVLQVVDHASLSGAVSDVKAAASDVGKAAHEVVDGKGTAAAAEIAKLSDEVKGATSDFEAAKARLDAAQAKLAQAATPAATTPPTPPAPSTPSA